jgi:hypothetical protein
LLHKSHMELLALEPEPPEWEACAVTRYTKSDVDLNNV